MPIRALRHLPTAALVGTDAAETLGVPEVFDVFLDRTPSAGRGCSQVVLSIDKEQFRPRAYYDSKELFSLYLHQRLNRAPELAGEGTQGGRLGSVDVV